MKIYRKDNVLEAAKKRIRWLFDEFETVTVCWSGGKDSTVALHLTLDIAEELGRTPIPVMWIDQEAEWDSVVRLARQVFSDPRVTPYWIQAPIRLFNSTSHESDWLNCWGEGEEWMRPKEPNSIHENVYGTDRFKAMFDAWSLHHFDGPVANIGGVRCEESPNRHTGLTFYQTYKWATWGRIISRQRQHFVFYPLYDWSYSDIWRAIHEHGWPYPDIYDKQYSAGVAVQNMRVSNLHHESAVGSILYMHEAEPETWQRLQERVAGANSFRQLEEESMRALKLPFMFDSWKEYRDFLLEKLIQDDGHRELFRARFQQSDEAYAPLNERWRERLHRTEINSMLLNDWHMTKIMNVLCGPTFPYRLLRQAQMGRRVKGRGHATLTEACPDYAEGRIGVHGGSAADAGADQGSAARTVPAEEPAG